MMVRLCDKFIHCGAVCVLVLVATCCTQRKPYILKMCQVFQHSTNCPRWSFPYLYCNEILAKLDKAAKLNQERHRLLNRNIKPRSIAVISTPQPQQFSPRSQQNGNTSKQNNKGQEPVGLLVAPYVFKPNLFELNLQSLSVKTYPPIKREKILVLAYVPSIRKVIFGTEKPRQRLGTISAINLENQVMCVLRRFVITYNLAADETRKEIFTVTSEPSNDLGIYRMDYKGKNFQKVLSIYSNPQALALDTAIEVIVVSFGYYVKTMTYTGKSLQVIDGDRTRAVALDYSGKFLYYNVKQTLQRWDRATKTNTEIVKLHFTPNTFVLYKDTLYVSSFKETLVSAYDLREEKFVEVPKIHNKLGNVICLFSY